MLKVVILGSGNAFGHGNQFQSSHYIEFEEKHKLLLDCGPTILQALQSSDVNVDDLQYLLNSHLHGDHMAGIPFLLLHYKYILKRFTNPLQILGPPGLKDQLMNLLTGNYPNLLSPEENLFNVQEILVNEEIKILDSIAIRSYEAHHIPNAFGYTIQYSTLKVIYSGDNKLDANQIKQFKNGTVLIHELSTLHSTEGGHTSWDLMKDYVDEILNNVNKIIAVHTNLEVRNESEETFDRKIIRARDGSVFLFNEKGRLYQMVL